MVPQEAIAAIQQAGQALHLAHAHVKEASQAQSERVREFMAGSPFGVEGDALFEDWKALSRLTASLAELESGCASVFHAANGIGYGRAAAKGAKDANVRALPHVPKAVIEDVAHREPVAPVDAEPGTKPQTVRPMRGNAVTVYEWFRSVLNRKSYRKFSHTEIAAAAAIPTGSVGLSVKTLLRRGLVLEGKDKGTYKLA